MVPDKRRDRSIVIRLTIFILVVAAGLLMVSAVRSIR